MEYVELLCKMCYNYIQIALKRSDNVFFYRNNKSDRLTCNDKNDQTERRSFEYIDLAPVDTYPNDSEYFNALNWAINCDKVKNIAISGPYGSGKSSIIRSYLKENQDVKKASINISMAEFESEMKSNADESTVEVLEKGILKQLFYRVNHRRIPQSRYRKLHSISVLRVFLSITAVLIFIFGLVTIISPVRIKRLIENIKNVDEIGVPLFVFYPSLTIVTMFVIYLLSLFVSRIVTNAQLKNIELPATVKVERSVESDSVFNKNMDEIVYFFEATDYKFVFFEDFDRFDNSNIFVELRELNTLLNNDENIKRNIVFIYAIRDDIFENEDRTKFFDFIIPVIPVMNSTNSADFLIEKFLIPGDTNKPKISREYIFDVSPFISDMRVLHNIYNEFMLYKKTLQEKQDLNLIDEEMLSLIIFKNIYPKEFADLQAEEGIVKDAFNSVDLKKRELYNKESESIESDMQLIREIEREAIRSKKEIKTSMMSALTEWQGDFCDIRINGTSYYAKQIIDDEFDLNFPKPIQNIVVEYYDWNIRNHYSVKEKIVDKDILDSYIARWNNFLKYKDVEIKMLQERIEDNKKIIREINSYTLKKLIELYGAQAVLPNSTNENDLLRFFLRRGYINEKYPNYINYFKGKSITKDDMNFILSVKNQQPLNPAYVLCEFDTIISRLQEYEFGTRAIYNYDILETLLTSPKKYKDKLDAFINQLSNDEEAWEFIDDFIDRSQQIGNFIRLMSKKCVGFWEIIYNNFSLTYERQLMYLKMLLAYAEIEDIERQDDKGAVTAFIIENNDILQKLYDLSEGVELTDQRLNEVISKLDIRFDKVLLSGVSHVVTDHILSNNHYVINQHMINEIVNIDYPELSKDVYIKNYSTIRKINNGPLLKYIDENLTAYINGVFLKDENIHEEIDSVLWLVMKAIDDSDLIRTIINHEKFCVNSLNDFGGDLLNQNGESIKLIWNQLLEEDKVCCTWENVIIYWSSFGFSEELIEYVNDNIEKLMASNTGTITDDFITELISTDIYDNVFERTLKIHKVVFNNLTIEKISTSKIEILIKLHCIPFSASEFLSINNSHADLLPLYIIENQDEFAKDMDNYCLTSDVLIVVLTSYLVTMDFKQKLIDAYARKSMSLELANHIIDNDYSIDESVFFEAWERISDSRKPKLFIRYYNVLGADGLQRCFEELEEYYPGFADRTKRHKVGLDNTVDNKELLDYLYDKEYATKYNIEEKNNRITCFIKPI